jgi:hypothetical protein
MHNKDKARAVFLQTLGVTEETIEDTQTVQEVAEIGKRLVATAADIVSNDRIEVAKQKLGLFVRFGQNLLDMSSVEVASATMRMGGQSIYGSGSATTALPSGGTSTPAPSPTPAFVTFDEALDTVLTDPGMSDGQKNAIRRLLSTNGDKIDVLPDGTPSATSAADQKVKDVQALLNAAHSGAGVPIVSNEAPDKLKSRFADAVKPATPTPGGVDKVALKAELDKVVTALKTARPSNLGKKEKIIPNDKFEAIMVLGTDPKDKTKVDLPVGGAIKKMIDLIA